MTRGASRQADNLQGNLQGNLQVTQPPQHSSQGGAHGPRQGKGPLGTWLVIALLVLVIFMMWFLVLGTLEARS